MSATGEEDEVERLRLEWLALVGTSRAAQRAAKTKVETWWAWTRWQSAKADLAQAAHKKG